MVLKNTVDQTIDAELHIDVSNTVIEPLGLGLRPDGILALDLGGPDIGTNTDMSLFGLFTDRT